LKPAYHPGAVAIPTDLSLDGILRRTADRVPERAAIRTPIDDVSFAELDDRVSRMAAAIEELVGPQPARVAVTPVPGVAYPVTLFGAARGGHVAVALKQMLRGPGLEHVLRTTQARLAFVTEAMFNQLQPAWARLPELAAVILVDGDIPDGHDRVYQLADLLEGADPDAAADSRVDPASVVYVHFTHGTTGEPKGVQLTHRNLVANAVQTAHAHELDELDTVLNHLPVYHCMHLNGPVWAGATQVLCTDPDPRVAVEMANTYQAKCFYAQPGQLARLAVDPCLQQLKFTTVQVVRTGGTDLKPATAITLANHFGVPVLQGYGMVETAALTHSDKRARPRVGSVGPAVLGTESRVVDIDTRVPLPPGERGEVQIRAPQVMVGYLGRDEPPVDAHGWLSTGDIGSLDADGYLSIVDRRSDLFKVGNELVSPTEVERVLLAHPDVRECAVVAYPDPLLGSVPYALVVPATPAGSVRLADVVTFANRELLPHQQIRHIAIIDAIPGAQFGKIHRRQLRERLAAERPHRINGTGGAR
jgi:long-chain acyl-CoA synthetase